MKTQEILNKYITFFENRGHKLIPNVSLVPESDPTLLFVNSGMFPLVNYLSGEQHPLGNKLVNVQRCVRFGDIEEVGESNRHTVAFHMIGNWSLGDYFKEDQLPWIWEFYVEVLGLDVNKMYATVFAGDKDAPKDKESIKLLKDIFKKYGLEAHEGERIFTYGKEDNWWKRGDTVGELGGPDSETFYYIGTEGTGMGKNPADNQDEFIEIGNSVFMQYKKSETGWEPLKQRNVDFGGGLERIAMVVQNKKDIFETDNFFPVIQRIEEISGKTYSSNDDDTKTKELMRILADHMRTALLIAMDGVVPNNKEQGYILRRILRRMTRVGRILGVNDDISVSLVKPTAQMLEWMYPQLTNKTKDIEKIFLGEERKFRKILHKGANEVEIYLNAVALDAQKAYDTKELATKGFDLYQSLGYPYEIFVEDVVDADIKVDVNSLETMIIDKINAHKKLSRQGAHKKFSGGLADQSEQTIKYHTATHLLHWALRKKLGPTLEQEGSNITGERLRFDVSYPKKLTSNELCAIETLINDKIIEGVKVSSVTLPKQKALETGALHFFEDTYGDKVKVYFIGDTIDTAFSKEFCGGPHVENTSEIGEIKIYKQKKIGENILRLYLRAKG